MNENYIKLARLNGQFVWHKHDSEDEMFVVLSGILVMEFREEVVEIKPGEILIKGAAKKFVLDPYGMIEA